MEYKAIDASIHIKYISENIEIGEDGYCMNLLYEDQDKKCLSIKGKKYELRMGVCDWGTDTRIKSGHIYLGSEAFNNYFAQVELSHAIEDENYIYIVKNISKLAGEGAIYRLNKNAEDKNDKYMRREILIEELKSEVIEYKNSRWIVVNKILKSDMNDENKHADIIYDFILNFLKYAFCIEEIIEKY